MEAVEGGVELIGICGKLLGGVQLGVQGMQHPQGTQDTGGNGGIPSLKAEQFAADADEFYSTFYGFTAVTSAKVALFSTSSAV